MTYNGSITRYIYSAAGEKLRVTHLTAVPNITVPIGTARELAPSEILAADSTDYLLGGTLTMKNGRIDKYQFEEGYCQAVRSIFNPSQDGFTFYYYDRDHLGSVRQVIEAEGTDQGTVVQKMNYYPSGLQFCNNVTDSDKQSRRYNGKELDRMHGLNTYDYGARQYNPVTARWDRMDPLCEKYYGVSPYAYCGNNPMNRIDPDGRDVVIVGPLANMALLQLQERIGNDVKLFLTNDNYLCYDIVGKGNLNKSSQTLIEIIDNSDITVNITTTDKKETSSGALLVGGAFMGTNVELDANGNVVHTTAYQEVNPQVLNEADKYSSKGTFMMHELTEAYEGAKISAKKKISSPNSKGDNSVYSEAHKNATTQPAVYQRLFDKDGEQTKNPKEAQKVEWYVKPYSSSKDEHTIQNLP